MSMRDGGVCVYLWLIHDGTWQKTTRFSKAIIPQIKKKKCETVKWLLELGGTANIDN